MMNSQRSDEMNHILNMLEETVKIYENKIAVIEEERSCTYNELQLSAKSIATFLLHQNISHKPVIVFMEKGINALNAFLGISYAGNFYSLLDPNLPYERLRQIQSVLHASVVITDTARIKEASSIFTGVKIHCVEDMVQTPIENKMIEQVMKTTLDTDPLYINFTSGSTGVPKGVVISHGSVVNFIETFVQTFSFSAEERFGNQAPFDFDVSVKDIYTCLKTGATLVIIPRSYFSNPSKLLDYICEHKITTMVWAVSALSLICSFHGLEYKVPKQVNKILFSGEVMPYKHMLAWRKALPDALLVNLYGPTEITCNCTYHIIENNRNYEQAIPIGKPFKNYGVFLLDENNKEIKNPYQIGEICIKGRGLALGYYNAMKQTKDRFIDNPLCTEYTERIYKTGDLAHYNKAHELVFKGRKDFQIKYLGHRIELEEIERKATQLQQVEQFCVVFDEQKKRLYGLYSGEVSRNDLLLHLKKNLPSYMIPGKLISIDMFPLNKNGKIDRKTLLEIAKGGK